MNNERNAFSITWIIENYSYCWHKHGEDLESPQFDSHGLMDTIWSLKLYPRGNGNSKDKVSLILTRNKRDKGPETFTPNFRLSILAADGTDLIIHDNSYAFKKGFGNGFNLVTVDEMFSTKRADYLPNDTLRVRCKIWMAERIMQSVTQIIARTRIEIGQISFLHVVDGFSLVKPNEKKTLEIITTSVDGFDLRQELYITHDSFCKGMIMAEITTSRSVIPSNYKISLVDSSGKIIKCNETDNRFDAEINDLVTLPLNLTWQYILKNKSEYLPDDKLTLLCECIYSRGIQFEKIETIIYDLPLALLDQVRDKDKDIRAEKLSKCSSITDDLKAVYNNQYLADVELKTKTKTFPAHKIVLCARSSVFNAMLHTDMNERNSGCIKLDDLEDKTVQQLLYFLYSDSIENLQWESAIKLYYVADKYAIGKLMVLCSTFLVDNVTTSTAGELLLLADSHNDSDLKSAAEDYIIKHEQEVFGSDEWGDLMEKNLVLASQTMRRKYLKKL